MIRLQTIILGGLILLFFSQAKVDHKNNYSIAQCSIDTSVIAIIPFDTSDIYSVFKKAKPATLSSNDLSDIEILIDSSINVYNVKRKKEFVEFQKTFKGKVKIEHFVIDLKRYKRQYVAVINEKGEKEVWVNCFCYDFGHNWRKQIIEVDDGGNCYFNLKINLSSKKYYDFYVNGVA